MEKGKYRIYLGPPGGVVYQMLCQLATAMNGNFLELVLNSQSADIIVAEHPVPDSLRALHPEKLIVSLGEIEENLFDFFGEAVVQLRQRARIRQRQGEG